mmetsp:Transcript_33822/g.88827  ORF Transcript_33822/g.88827 Transcript_33822/m.88827 type:complete len:323 (-) Transcript_33822:88-1056(-)
MYPAVALLAGAAVAQNAQTWRSCPGIFKFYPCAGCNCNGDQTMVGFNGDECSLIEINNNATALYAFELKAATGKVGICGSSNRQDCLQAFAHVRTEGTFPPTSTTLECFGSHSEVTDGNCVTETAGGGTPFSIIVHPECAGPRPGPPPPPPGPGHCVDVPSAELEHFLTVDCENNPTAHGQAWCNAQNCDELAASLQTAGTSCSAHPELQAVCCASCQSHGGGDGQNCQQHQEQCLFPILRMLQEPAASCCPALHPPVTNSSFSNPAVINECHACAVSAFGGASGLNQCSCCVLPLLQRFAAGSVGPIPANFIRGVFGNCTH